MSGIVGVYNSDGRPVDHMDIKAMMDSIAHRGPDGSGVWTDGPIGLGHLMLQTTPESLHEKLPMLDETGNLAIIADVRIDNRDELISILNFNGRPKEAISDSELILASYEKWEEACPEKLLGDFSFALWDGRKRRLFCARDPLGNKPFYYFVNGRTVRWASEPEAIFREGEIDKEPNRRLICLYLLHNFDDQEETLYRGICRLPPSHFMVFEKGGLRKQRYWDVDSSYTIHYRTDEEYGEHLLGLFKDAVRVRLRSCRPVGALLSGGIDSSSIVGVAQVLYRDALVQDNGFETFSIVFDQLPCDERFYINEIVQKYGLSSNFSVHEKNLRFLDIERMSEFPEMNYLPTLLFLAPVYSEARRKGIRVMLNGMGGDGLLALGYDHLTDLMFQGKLRKLFKQIRQDASVSSYSALSLFLNYCVKPLIPKPIKPGLKAMMKQFRRNPNPSLVKADSLSKIGGKQPFLPRPLPRFATRSQQGMYEFLYFGWNVTVASDIRNLFEARFNIEARDPFSDRRMVEFLMAIPEEQRWNDQWPKAVLRRAMVGILPETVRKRMDKAEFSPVIDLELRERQVDKIQNLVQESILVKLEIVDAAGLNSIFESYKQRRGGYEISNLIGTFVWLELWYRLAIDKKRGGTA